MSKKTKVKIRLYVEHVLQKDGVLVLEKRQAHYLCSVMRQKCRDKLKIFNGRDGEFLADIIAISKKQCQIKLIEQIKAQETVPDIMLCFAPVKNAPLNFLTQKAVELGIKYMQPIITEHTIIAKDRVNIKKMLVNAVEAAEQCGRLEVPVILDAIYFGELISTWDKNRHILLCDETGAGEPIAQIMLRLVKTYDKNSKFAIFIGPEGGFAQSELEKLRGASYVNSLSMGGRILRADTAALAALAIVQAFLGDWDKRPDF